MGTCIPNEYLIVIKNCNGSVCNIISLDIGNNRSIHIKKSCEHAY